MKETKEKMEMEWEECESTQTELLLEALDAPLYEPDPEMVKRMIERKNQLEAEAKKK